MTAAEERSGPRLIALRTTPPENPHICDEPRFRGRDSRPISHWGVAPEQEGPLALPGRYSVRLTVDGQTLSQPLEIVSRVDQYDIRAGTADQSAYIARGGADRVGQQVEPG